MRRRSFVAAAGSWVTLPGALARAQARPRVAVLLVAFTEDAPGVLLFRDRLRALGHAEGRGFDLVFRVAEEPALLARRAAEVVALRPDIVVALHVGALEALQSLTRATPIVVVFCGDPIALGYSTSWSRPSGNVTGIMDGLDSLADKRVELLHELLPSARAFGLVYEPAISVHRVVLERTRAAVQSLGLALRPYPIGDVAELARIPARAAAEAVAALIVTPSPSIIDNRAGLIAAAIANRVPTMHSFGFEVVEGGVVAYGIEQAENWQRAADYVHRLLRGEPIASLPFERSARVLLTLNLATARAVGLQVPAAVVARADEVIE